jgi:hypothetical protein
MAGLLTGTGVHDTGGLEGSPSIWGPGWLGVDRSGGLLGYTPVTPSKTVKRGAVDVPIELAMHEGANKYENYVRAWPDLLHHYLNNIPTDDISMADWGKQHWLTHGSTETDPSMEAWRGRGMWGDTPIPRTHLGPGRFQASKHLPAMDAEYDPRAGTTQTTYSAGVPMPDVEGYKYAYRPYQWSEENQRYEELAYNEFDQSKYPYYPYMPTGGRAPDRNDRILVGVRLVPK